MSEKSPSLFYSEPQDDGIVGKNGLVSVKLGSNFVFCFSSFLGFCFSQCQLHVTKPDRNNENLAADFFHPETP